MTDVLVVTGEIPWPAHQGGLVRTAGLIEGLATYVDVAVIALTGTAEGGEPVPVLTGERGTLPGTSMSDICSLSPRLGRMHWRPDVRRTFRRELRRHSPSTVLYAQSYLAAAAPFVGRQAPRVIVDFQNIEVDRFRNFARQGRPLNRASATVEGLKARFWEPRLAGSVDVCLAIGEADARTLSRWGAREVVVVPNAVHSPEGFDPSPHDGYVLYVASADYGPNRDAGRRLVDAIWPQVLAQVPSAQLRIAGRRSIEVFGNGRLHDGVLVLGEVADLGPVMAAAAVVAAPVVAGAGKQLKVVNAVAAGRLVVASPYSMLSVPSGLEALAVEADTTSAFADSLVAALVDVPRRHRLELAGRQAASRIPTWASAAKAIVEAAQIGR